MSRPKEPPRVRLGIRVKPSTHKAIVSKVKRGDRTMNTHGKIIDALVEQKQA